jgi:hypothetical protein
MPTVIPDSPIPSPAGWLGFEQSNRSDWTRVRVLSAAEKADLDSATRAFRSAPIPLADVVVTNYSLPALRAAIKRWTERTVHHRCLALCHLNVVPKMLEQSCHGITASYAV